MLGAYRCYDLDELVLNIVAESLPEEQGNILQFQANHGSRCRHLFGNQWVGFSHSRSNLQEQSMLFRYRGPTRPIASLTLSESQREGDRHLRAEIAIGEGMIREILYDRRPQSVFGEKKPKWQKLAVQGRPKLLFNPNEVDPFPSSQVHDASVLPDWLKAWANDFQATYVSCSLPRNERDRLADFHDLPFPQDYLDTVAQFEQVVLSGGVRILGLSNIWSYITPTEYVVKLADVQGRGVLCMIRNGGEELHYIDNEAHIPVPVGRSFRGAIEHALLHGVDDWGSDRSHKRFG